MESSKKPKSKTPAKKPKDSVLEQKSPAEFFAENKNIAGFDNPGKSLYTTVRELVENALDFTESISELPLIEITIEDIEKSKFNPMIGLVDRDRVDEELYDDHETAKAREKRLAKEAQAQELQAKNASLGKKVKEPAAPKTMKARGGAAFYRVTCKDNGRGMPHDDIPNMFGRVLSGTKYGLKQTRGKFGLGAKMVTGLVSLNVSNSCITNSGLRHLKLLKSLKSLSLEGCKVAANEIRKLQLIDLPNLVSFRPE